MCILSDISMLQFLSLISVSAQKMRLSVMYLSGKDKRVENVYSVKHGMLK